jgi:hypothetical protein
VLPERGVVVGAHGVNVDPDDDTFCYVHTTTPF